MKKKKQFRKKVFKENVCKELRISYEETFFKNLVCNQDRIQPVQIPPKVWLNINYETLSLSEGKQK